MNERDFIALLRPLAGPQGLNLDDDAALIKPPTGHDLVISKDMMVEGVHFPKGRIGGGFSERLLRTALSDLAAKGARPTGYMLSIAWPKGRDPHWINGFVSGLRDAQSSFDCPLIGGDTTSTDGPLVASATVFGVVPTGTAVLRSGAKIGDDIWHTGRLGMAEHGLAIIMEQPTPLRGEDRFLAEEAYLRPEPRFVFRKTLRSYATACADISDGILSEAGHIASASEVHMGLIGIDPKNVAFGDDYELIFTADKLSRDAIVQGAKRVGLEVTRCGKVASGRGVSIDGVDVVSTGYRHTL